MSKTRKILLIFLLSLFVLFSLAFGYGYLKRDELRERIVLAVRRSLEESGFRLEFSGENLNLFGPSFSLSSPKLFREGEAKPLLSAKRLRVSLSPVKMLSGFSPILVTLSGVKSDLTGDEIETLLSQGKGRSGNGKFPGFLPSLEIRDVFLRLLFPEKKSIVEGEFSRIFIGSSLGRSLVVEVAGRERGLRLKREGGEEVTGLFYGKARITSRDVRVSRVFMSSSFVAFEGRGHYDFPTGDYRGVFTGQVSLEEGFHLLGISSPLLPKGKVRVRADFSRRDGTPRLDLSSDLGNVKILGVECEGGLRCVLKGGKLRVSDLRVVLPGGEVRGSGEVTFPSLTGEVKLDTSPIELASLRPVTGRFLPFDLEGEGTLQASLRLDSSRVIRTSVKLSSGRGLAFHRDGKPFVKFSDPLLLEWEGEVRDFFSSPRVENISFSGESGKNRFAGKGYVDLESSEGNFSLKLELPEPESISLREIPLTAASVRGKVGGKGRLSDPTLSLDIVFESASLPSLPPGRLQVKGEGRFSRALSLVIDYVSRAGEVTATGTYHPDTTLFTGSAVARGVEVGFLRSLAASESSPVRETMQELSPYLPEEGTVSFTGDIAVGEKILTGDGEVELRDVAGKFYEVPLVKGRLRVEEDFVQVKEFSVVLKKGRAQGRGLIKGDSIYAEVESDAVDLASLAGRLFGGEKGPVKGVLSGGAIVEFHGEDLTNLVGDFRISDASAGGVSVGDVSLDVTLEGKVVRGGLSAEGGKVGGAFTYRLDSRSLALDLNFSRFEIGLARFLPGRLPLPEDVALTGEIRGEVPSFSLKGEELLKRVRGNIHLTLEDRSAGELILSVVGKQRGDRGTFSVDFAERGNLSLRTEFRKAVTSVIVEGRVRTGAFPFTFPSGVEGKADVLVGVDGLLSIRDGRVVPSGTLVVEEGNLAFLDETLAVKRCRFSVKEGEISIEEAIFEGRDGEFEVTGGIYREKGLDLTLRGKVPASAVRTVVRGVFEGLGGALDAHLRVVGRYPDIQLTGEATLDDGYVKFVGFRHPLEAAKTKINLRGRKIEFEKISATMGGGSLTGTGQVVIFPGRPVFIQFNADFFNVSFGYPDDLPSVIDGSVEIAGPSSDLFIRGDVNVRRARYTKSIYPEELLVSLRKKIKRYETVAGDRFTIRLDITCVADGTIEVHNNLGDLKARGDFKVLGNTGKVVVIGTFESVEGEVKYRGTEYTIERLIVDFRNPLRNNPDIDALASTQKGEYTIYVEVTGTLEDFQVDFYSDPPLSKNDIASLLSLGVTTGEITSSEGGAATTGFAAVALSPLTSRVEEKLGRFVGFDRFSIEAAYSESTGVFEPTVVVGKTFGDALTVDFSTPLGGTGQSSVSGELRISSSFYVYLDWLSSTTDAAGEFGGEIRYRKKYPLFRSILGGLFGEGEW